MTRLGQIATSASLLLLVANTSFAQAPPSCRYDEEGATAAGKVIRMALGAYTELGTPLPINKVLINPSSSQLPPGTLGVYVLSDASASAVGRDGCLKTKPALIDGEELDDVSVRGGCVASADRLEIRCSSIAVQMFGKQGTRPGYANPALLYLLSHELWHIQQHRPGEYAGRVDLIKLKQPRDMKLQMLQAACEPGLIRAEEDADRNAIRVLVKLLPDPPYREPAFSAQGSVLWGADQLNLAANTWRKSALEREFISQPKPHKSFIQTEFPTPPAKVQKRAKEFVCDVLTKRSGVVAYPGRSATHPALEVRIQKVAEALRPLASDLPKAGAQEEYRSMAVLQEQLSDIFSFMYRESGIYLEAVQSAICTRVNSDLPTDGCTEK